MSSKTSKTAKAVKAAKATDKSSDDFTTPTKKPMDEVSLDDDIKSSSVRRNPNINAFAALGDIDDDDDDLMTHKAPRKQKQPKIPHDAGNAARKLFQ